MVGLQTLDLAIGVRVPASQPKRFKHLRAAQLSSRPFCVIDRTSCRNDCRAPAFMSSGSRYFRLFMRHTAEAATIPYMGIPKRTP